MWYWSNKKYILTIPGAIYDLTGTCLRYNAELSVNINKLLEFFIMQFEW